MSHCLYCLNWPLRGHARSHRDRAKLETGAVPVGAGVPAKGPEQAKESPASIAGLVSSASQPHCCTWLTERGATGWLSLEMVTSTRRFCARPELLELSATGYSLP